MSTGEQSTAQKAGSFVGHQLTSGIKIEALLGEGGFAQVYRGTRGEPPTDVAVKILNPEFSSDETFVERFRREAKAAISIAHPNAVQILDYGVDGDIVYIVMELVRGSSLHEVLSRERRVAEKRAVKVLAQICEALSAAHDQGIVHRDLKPENVMLLGDPSHPMGEWVKVLDFGIAKLLDAGSARSNGGEDDDAPDSGRAAALTRLGTVLGTPEYMAPEQARGEGVDARSDIYACGVLLYQLLTGRVPFQGRTPAHTVMLHTHEPLIPPGVLAPELHPGLEKLIVKALQKSPGDRHQTAEELRDELLGLADVVSEMAPVTPHPTPAAALELAPTMLQKAATPMPASAPTRIEVPRPAAAPPEVEIVPAAPVAAPVRRRRGAVTIGVVVVVLVLAMVAIAAVVGR